MPRTCMHAADSCNRNNHGSSCRLSRLLGRRALPTPLVHCRVYCIAVSGSNPAPHYKKLRWLWRRDTSNFAYLQRAKLMQGYRPKAQSPQNKSYRCFTESQQSCLHPKTSLLVMQELHQLETLAKMFWLFCRNRFNSKMEKFWSMCLTSASMN
jgi:hypothetical protein